MHQQKGMENISITWRGKKFILEMNPDATLKQLGDELQKLTDVKADTMRLISPQSSNKSSTLLHPFSDEHSGQSLQELSLFERKSIRMMGVPKGEVDELLQTAKADLRIAGFDEEEKRLRQRTGRPHISPKLPQGTYIFCDFCTLHLPGVELNPPASEALALMHRLASDQGIVAIMNKHRWRVGIMTEMAPEGYVGVSPKCILGFNKNHGEEISLRLRTDDLKGFRKYESIKKTLLHELAHMVHSEHDANFYALDKLINQEAASLDWTRSRSHTLSGIRHSEHHVDEVYVDNSTSVSHRVGGKSSEQLPNARESSVAAAYRRLADTSTKILAPSGAQAEPYPDDSVPHSRVEHAHFNAIDKENALNRNISQWEFKNEPYLDDSNVSEKKFEPDPDDSMDGEAMQSESADSGGNVTMEPDPDDSMNIHFVPALANKRDFEGAKGYDEPDPDDLQTCLGGRRMVELDHVEEMDTLDCMVQPRKNISKPDPDDSRSVKHIIEWGNMDGPCHDGTMENERPLDSSCKEPLTDDSQADGMMETEPDPDENTVPNPDDNMVPLNEISHMQIDVHDQELKRIQDPVTIFCGRLQKAIEMLRSEVSTVEAATILQTLFKIIRNVIEHPDEMKFKQLRKANPTIQKTVANYKGAMEILFLIGFNEDVVLDEIGKAETYLILKRNDPGLLWLAKSSLEACIAY